MNDPIESAEPHSPVPKKRKLILSDFSDTVPTTWTNSGTYAVLVAHYVDGSLQKSGLNILHLLLSDSQNVTVNCGIFGGMAEQFCNLRPNDIVHFHNFLIDSNEDACKFLGATAPFTVKVNSQTEIENLPEKMVPNDPPTEWATLEQTKTHHRNVLLKYKRVTVHPQAIGNVESLWFVTKDNKTVKVVYFNSQEDHAHGLNVGEMYLLHNTYYHHKFDVEYSDCELIGYDSVYYTPITPNKVHVGPSPTISLRDIHERKLKNGHYSITVRALDNSVQLPSHTETLMSDYSQVAGHALKTIVWSEDNSEFEKDEEIEGTFQINVEKGVVHLLLLHHDKNHTDSELRNIDDLDFKFLKI